MKINDSEIHINDKVFARYEIYIEAYDYHKSMRFPIKHNSLIEDEFNAAVDMCNEENKKCSFTHIYRKVAVIDRAKAKIIMEEKCY